MHAKFHITSDRNGNKFILSLPLKSPNWSNSNEKNYLKFDDKKA